MTTYIEDWMVTSGNSITFKVIHFHVVVIQDTFQGDLKNEV